MAAFLIVSCANRRGEGTQGIRKGVVGHSTDNFDSSMDSGRDMDGTVEDNMRKDRERWCLELAKRKTQGQTKINKN